MYTQTCILCKIDWRREYLTAVFVRDPLERLVSAYKEKFCRGSNEKSYPAETCYWTVRQEIIKR